MSRKIRKDSYPRYWTHGMTNTPEHRSWTGMKGRCINPKNKRWHRYGGRGISVCERWLESFENFYADMGPKPVGTSLERVNNDGNYEPSNCIWATPKQQQNNMRRNVFLEYRGKRLTIAQWAREIGIDRGTLRARKRRGWTVEEIFNPDVTKALKRTPVKPSPRRCVVADCGRETGTRNITLCKRHAQAVRRGTPQAELRAEILPPSAKLTPASVEALRAEVKEGKSTKEIAQRFGISKATVRDVARGKTWLGAGL
jgi:hypothetical protein